MFPRFPSPRSLSSYAPGRKPSKLTLGAAAATAAAAIGVTVGMSAGAGHPAGATSAGAIKPATAVSASGHRGISSFSGADAVAGAGQAVTHTAIAHTPAHDRLASGDRTGLRTTVTHPAKAAHHVTVLRHNATHRHAAARKPYLIYDSVTPSSLPSNHVNAVYATGGYAASPSQVAGRHVLWIDTTGTDPRVSVLDVEPGDATPSQAATWAQMRLTAHPDALARIYTFRAEWPATQAAIAQLPAKMRSHVRWWIADPTGYPHIVPGSDATQWYWGSSYDMTTATPRF